MKCRIEIFTSFNVKIFYSYFQNRLHAFLNERFLAIVISIVSLKWIDSVVRIIFISFGIFPGTYETLCTWFLGRIAFGNFSSQKNDCFQELVTDLEFHNLSLDLIQLWVSKIFICRKRHWKFKTLHEKINC